MCVEFVDEINLWFQIGGYYSKQELNPVLFV